jgi:hypothetical protein
MKLLAALALSLLAGAAVAQAPVPKPGHYCLRTDIGAGESDEAEVLSEEKLDEGLDDRRVKIGKLGVDLDITEQGGRTYVSFSNYMPDNGQVVRNTEPSQARAQPDGSLAFTFTDNWRAPGRGTVKTEGQGVVLSIERTKPAEGFAGIYSARQFGEFKLNPGSCPPNR